MKIDQINASDPIAATSKAAQAPARGKDKVTLERSEAVAKAISLAKVSAGAGRAARLTALEAGIRSGSYQPSPSRIAEKMLSSAEADAQMLALLNR